MIHQRRSILALVIGLTLFFNIERLDFGQQDLIDILSFVYVIGTLATLSLITVPPLSRASFPVPLVLWMGVYLLCRLLIFDDRPLLGGIHTYLSITEVALLSLLIWLAHDLGRSLHDFEEAVKNITLADISHRIRKLNEAEQDIQLELVRSRRHQRPMSVILVEMKPESVRAALHRTVQEVQRAMMTRYVVTSLARVISKQIRRTDMVLNQEEQGRFVILSPDTNMTSSTVVARRIQAAAVEGLGVSVTCGVAAFPEDALTFEELLLRAELNLRAPVGTPPSPPFSSADSAKKKEEAQHGNSYNLVG
jgi:hypothetical protein